MGGLNIVFDDSALADLNFPLPSMDIQAGQTLRIAEPGTTGDITTNGNIFFDAARGGAVMLCTGVCSGPSNIIDVVAFSEGAAHPTLPSGVSFSPSGLSGISISNQFLQAYVRTSLTGRSPQLLSSDWIVQ